MGAWITPHKTQTLYNVSKLCAAITHGLERGEGYPVTTQCPLRHSLEPAAAVLPGEAATPSFLLASRSASWRDSM